MVAMTPTPERFGYPDFTGKAILVVDDHQDSLDFLSELLAEGARALDF